ncbi:oxidoreductase [Mycolicibacterium agri]|uniref:Oxidoreductase n=1 Tax=Mycolicibacterium agri TaxID=36811 RepID=A0A2A7NF92_MYCAG|nr:SDR family oxidoreductase [Mycolicibacterium agri]PEG42705.1 oxidoreductase [Mycolicibacterium agri]GFG52688.1 oxidoreductase [Mycolicibacterium agri]
MEEFRGQTVLVTGASSGIGAAVAVALATAGASVAVHYRSNADGARAVLDTVTSAGARGLLVKADLTEPSGADEVVGAVEAELGSIDILINNAGDLGQRAEVADVSDEVYQHIMDLNIGTVFRVCRRVVPTMVERGSGAIVNVSSIAARTGGGGRSVIYASAKAAVSTFTRGLAREVGSSGVRVNAVAPGVIDTPFHDRHSTPERLEKIAASNPLKRIGTPQDCVGPVLFLASPVMAGYVTGQVIEVNGGALTP